MAEGSAAPQERATCRGCGRVLRGAPYYRGAPAFVPETGERAKVNHYGGWVCSYVCDVRASVRQLQTMPGCADATRPGCYAMQRIRSNWPEAFR